MNRFHQGDIIIADAEPHSGHEIGGHDPEKQNIRRHFIVVSNEQFNRVTRKAICFPLTSKQKQDDMLVPFVDFDSKTNGSIILRDPVIYDLNSRHGMIIGSVNDNKLMALLKQAIVESV